MTSSAGSPAITTSHSWRRPRWLRRLVGGRRRTRRIRHHGVMVASSVLILAAVKALQPDLNVRAWLSLSLAYAGLAGLLVTLLLGPFNVVRRRTNPVSTDLRRDVGIDSTVASAAHVVLSLGDHFGGRVVQYFFDPALVALANIRHDPFGVGAWIGVLALIPFAVLAATSNDWSVRRLGRDRWKALHRLTYPLAILVFAHTVAFLVATDRSALFVGGVAVGAIVTLGAQLVGFALVLHRHRTQDLGNSR